MEEDLTQFLQHHRSIRVKKYQSALRSQEEDLTVIDYTSPQVIIIEGLNLSGIAMGEYELMALPLKLQGTDGSPARVVLREKTL